MDEGLTPSTSTRIGVLNVHDNSDGEASKKGSNEFTSIHLKTGKRGCMILTGKLPLLNRHNKSEMAISMLQIIPVLRRNNLS